MECPNRSILYSKFCRTKFHPPILGLSFSAYLNSIWLTSLDSSQHQRLRPVRINQLPQYSVFIVVISIIMDNISNLVVEVQKPFESFQWYAHSMFLHNILHKTRAANLEVVHVAYPNLHKTR